MTGKVLAETQMLAYGVPPAFLLRGDTVFSCPET